MADGSNSMSELKSVTLYSLFFREGFIPEHILLTSDELTWAVEQLLRHILNSRAAIETEPPQSEEPAH